MVCLGKSPPVFWSPAIDQPHWSDWVPMTYDQPLTQVTMEFMARQFTHILEVENNNNDRVWLSGWPVDGRERERERAQAAKPGRPIAREPTAHYIQYNYRCTMGFKTPFLFFVFFIFFLTWDSFSSLLISYLSRLGQQSCASFRLGIVVLLRSCATLSRSYLIAACLCTYSERRLNLWTVPSSPSSSILWGPFSSLKLEALARPFKTHPSATVRMYAACI